MKIEKAEEILRARYAAGEIESGLFVCGGLYVVMDHVYDETGEGVLKFTWFDSMSPIGEISTK
jgi:hypothetical protein